jgi:hypothetical protein
VRVEQRRDPLGEVAQVALTRDLLGDVPLGIDQDERRPGRDGVCGPGAQLGIVEHRVGDPEALDRPHDGLVIVLVGELGRMDADHEQVVAELPLEVAQLLEHVHAVDAGLREEVEQHDAPAQRCERERARGADEAARAVQFGRPHAHGRRHRRRVAARTGDRPARIHQRSDVRARRRWHGAPTAAAHG